MRALRSPLAPLAAAGVVAARRARPLAAGLAPPTARGRRQQLVPAIPTRRTSWCSSAARPQTAQLDGPFASPLQVALANTNGCPVTTRSPARRSRSPRPASGASGSVRARAARARSTVGTDSTGSRVGRRCSPPTTRRGSYTVTASSAYGTVSFSLTNTAAGHPGDDHAARPDEPAAPPSAAATRSRSRCACSTPNGNPGRRGRHVTFSLGSGGGGGSERVERRARAGRELRRRHSTGDRDDRQRRRRDLAGLARQQRRAAASPPRDRAARHRAGPFTLENLAGKPATFTAVGVDAALGARVGSRYGRPPAGRGSAAPTAARSWARRSRSRSATAGAARPAAAARARRLPAARRRRPRPRACTGSRPRRALTANGVAGVVHRDRERDRRQRTASLRTCATVPARRRRSPPASRRRSRRRPARASRSRSRSRSPTRTATPSRAPRSRSPPRPAGPSGTLRRPGARRGASPSGPTRRASRSRRRSPPTARRAATSSSRAPGTPGGRRSRSSTTGRHDARAAAAASRRPRLRPADLARLASIGVRTRRLRAALSALGIAIGVAAIVAVLGLSSSSQAGLLDEINQLGTNLLDVTTGQSFTGTSVPAAARRARHDRPHRPGLRRRLHRHAHQRERLPQPADPVDQHQRAQRRRDQPQPARARSAPPSPRAAS